MIFLAIYYFVGCTKSNQINHISSYKWSLNSRQNTKMRISIKHSIDCRQETRIIPCQCRLKYVTTAHITKVVPFVHIYRANQCTYEHCEREFSKCLFDSHPAADRAPTHFQEFFQNRLEIKHKNYYRTYASL